MLSLWWSGLFERRHEIYISVPTNMQLLIWKQSMVESEQGIRMVLVLVGQAK